MANIRTAMNRGAFDFLTKPIDFADFERRSARPSPMSARLRDARERQAPAERAHSSLSRYFSPNLARSLAADANALAPGGERREIATLFTDIAGFTPLVEIARHRPARQPAQRLSRSHDRDRIRPRGHGRKDHRRRHSRAVRRARRSARRPDRAIACAMALDGRAEAFRAEWNARGIPLGVTRIGVHAGPAIVGNFGGGRLFDYTAYGDTINAAARLEAANKQLGTRICVSAVARERAGAFFGRPIGDLMLRGRSEPLRCFEPLPERSREPRDAGLSRRLRETGGARSRRHRRLRRADRRAPQRPARPVPSQAPAQRRRRRADRTGLSSAGPNEGTGAAPGVSRRFRNRKMFEFLKRLFGQRHYFRFDIVKIRTTC